MSLLAMSFVPVCSPFSGVAGDVEAFIKLSYCEEVKKMVVKKKPALLTHGNCSLG